MTGIPLPRAASISDLMYPRATQLSSPQEVRQRLIDSRMGSGRSSQKRPIDVDHEQRRSIAKSGPRAGPAGGEYGLVALGEKFVPDSLVHRRRSLPRCAGLTSPLDGRRMRAKLYRKVNQTAGLT
jgi:hypothetical protein